MRLFRTSGTQTPLFDRFFRFLRALRAGDRAVLILAIGILAGGTLWSLAVIDSRLSAEVPTREGTLTEGILGTPRFVNPVLATTRADRDLSTLVYAGLARLDARGEIVPDLAESIVLSEDGRTYTATLRTGAVFHDDTPLTAEDVAFTIERIQDPALDSPLRASWDGVTVSVIDARTITFTLREPYAPFLENLTVGILPAHIWQNASNAEFPFSPFNSEPVGAGPYLVANVVRDKSGIPDSYTLAPHQDFHRGEPHLREITLNFYTNEEKLIRAFNNREIESIAGIAPALLGALRYNGGHELKTTPLSRVFAVFFNQNKSVALRDPAARAALAAAVDRSALIERALDGYALPTGTPLPAAAGAAESSPATTTPLDTARNILREGGWRVSEESGVWEKEIDGDAIPLAFSIATANTSVFAETGAYLADVWNTLGASVEINRFEQADLTQSVIRPRDYDALLFGNDLGGTLDLYSFWHSSQRNDPGLNVALYANITADGALETARTSRDKEEQREAIDIFIEEVAREHPAVFLYTPLFTYVQPQKLVAPLPPRIAEPQQRFGEIASWYRTTESVWPIFRQ